MFEKFIVGFKKNVPFFSLQFLFTWLFLRVLGFFRLPLLQKLGLSFLFFLLVWWMGVVLIERILNNKAFQYYLFLGYKIIDYYTQFPYVIYIVAFGLSFCPFFCTFFFHLFFHVELDLIDVKNLKITAFFLPSMDGIAIILCVFVFFHKFNASILLPQIVFGIPIESVRLNKGLRWEDILYYLVLYYGRHSPNSIVGLEINDHLYAYTKSEYFRYFPISKKYFDQLNESRKKLLLSFLADCELIMSNGEKDLKLYAKRKGEAFFREQYKKEFDPLCVAAAQEAIELNNRWFFRFLYTFYGGLLFFFCILNYSQLKVVFAFIFSYILNW